MDTDRTPIDTAALREREFPLTREWAYLNHGSIGPFPQRTQRALAAINEQFGTPHLWEAVDRAAPQRAVREAIARFAGTSADRVAFTGSLAHGMSICAGGVDWRPGDEVVIPHSEYPSLALPFLAQEYRGVRVRWAPKDEGGRTSLDRIAAAIGERTRAIAISHVEYADGYRNDLAALGQLCRDRGLLLLVDATQSLGAIPLRIEEWGVHAAAAHGYKWLHAGFGIGVLALSSEGMAHIRPTTGGGRAVAVDPYVAEPQLVWTDSAQRFETGEPPHTLLAGLAASLTLIEEVGIARILPHAQVLVDRLAAGVSERGWRVASSLDPAVRSQYVAITSGDREADVAAHATLLDAGVVTAPRPKGLRVAPTFYNDASDIDRLLAALPAR